MSSASSQSMLGHLVGEERTLLALHGRLLTLTDQTRWDGQHVPVAPRAFADGTVIHTNDLRVHLGEGYWAEMTAKQAAAFISRKIQALQSRIHLVQAELIESALPSSSYEPPAQPPGLAKPVSLAASAPVSSKADKAASPSLPPPPSSQSAPAPAPSKPNATAHSKIKPAPSSNKPSVKTAPVGQTRTLRDEAGKLMTDDLGFPLVEIIEPPSSPTSSKRKAPPPVSPVSRRTEKQRAEARKRAFEEAERDEKTEAEKHAKLAAPSRTSESSVVGQQRRLKGEDGKDLLDDEGLPMIEIVEPVASDSFPSTRPSPSLTPLPPSRSKAERASTLRQVLDDAEAEEATVNGTSRSSQTTDAPDPAPKNLAEVEDPLKLVEELLSPAAAASSSKDPVVPVNVLHEILSEDGLPISRIQEPLPSTPTSRPSDTAQFDPTAPLPPATPLPLALSAQTPARVKQSIFEKLEAEEKEMERRERLGLPPLEAEVVPAPEEEDEGEDTGWGEDEEEAFSKLTTPDKGKGKETVPASNGAPVPRSDKRKSVSWSEQDSVKEFKSTESPSAPSPPSTQTDTQPPAATGQSPPSAGAPSAAGETMKFKVVERAPVPVKAGKVKMGGAKEGGKTGWVKPVVTDEAMAYLADLEAKKAAAATVGSTAAKNLEDAPIPIARPTTNSRPSATASPTPVSISASFPSAPIPSATVEELDSDHDAEDDDSGSNDSFQFSDDGEDEDGEGGGLSMDMDDNMQLREAAVEYYRLRGVLQGKGGLSGAAGGTGDMEDKSEFVPLNATVSQSLDSTTLSLPTGPLNSSSAASRFKSSILTPAESASVDLPTLIPGGGATGALAGAIRVGKLENGKLVIGRGKGPDGEELDDSSDEESGEEGELSEAGKEALMWGMVGGVVVSEEDLQKGGEELLAKVNGTSSTSDSASPAPTRMDFYQADKTVTVSVYEKGLIPADVRVEFEARQVLIHLPTRSIALAPLSAPINATLSSFRVSSVKIELTLMKTQVGHRWNSITTGSPAPPAPAPAAPPAVSTEPIKESETATPKAVSPPPPAPAAPAKVSRFKAARQASSAEPLPPAPVSAPAATAPSPPALVSDPTERTPIFTASGATALAPVRRNQPAQVSSPHVEPVDVEEEEEQEVIQPKKRVSRFKAERMKA